MKKTLTLLAAVLVAAALVTGCQESGESGGSGDTSALPNAAIISEDAQTVTTAFASGEYAPITVQVGIPVKWTIQMNEQDLNGCNYEMQIPEFGVTQQLSAGDTVVSFTPDETGTFPYSCWMGMIRSEIIVVDDVNEVNEVDRQNVDD